MLNLATALAARSHRIDLVMARKEGRFLDEIPGNVNVVDLKVGSTRCLLPAVRDLPRVTRRLGANVFNRKAAWLFAAVPALASYLDRHRPVALLSALNYPNVVALLARRLRAPSTRLVISVHNHLSTAVAHARKKHEREIVVLAHRLYPEADKIVAVSDGVSEDLAQTLGLSRARITRIYNPVFRPEIVALAESSLDHPWLVPGAPPVLLGIGKLKPQKNFAYLVRAFARVRALRPARLIILGEGPERAALLSLARELKVADAVSLPGFVANPFAYFGRAAVFILSSAWEGFANVLIEALACGCPVVSTDCPSGPAEILEQGKYGALVPVSDDQALAHAISTTLDHPPPGDHLRDRARFFSIDRAAAQYLPLLLED